MKINEILINKKIITEGLIKVPNELLKSLIRHVYSEYLSYMYQNISKRDDAIKLANKLSIDIDKNFKPKNTDIELNIILDGVSDKIKQSWKLEFGYLRLIIDWEQKIWANRPKVNASYEESNEHGIPGYFTINPLSFMDLLKSDKYSMESLIDLFEKIKTSMWHEASHAVQHNALKWLDKNQIGKDRKIRNDPNSSPEDRRREYLSAAVEFDPQIKTKIFQFHKIAEKDPANILKNLAIFVGANQSEDTPPDEFFDAIKKTNIKKWKKAVKLFYLNYGFDVSNLLKTIPDTEGK
jgi:hypothetical protein